MRSGEFPANLNCPRKMEKALGLPTEISGSRLATPQDEAFLFRLFAEDSADQLAASGIPELQVQKLVEMQYRGRRTTYAARYPQAENRILITADGKAGGRVLIDRKPAPWHIVDIGVLAADRGKGLATRAIEECQAQCRKAQMRLELQVNPDNPARRLYERLGFRAIQETEISIEMVWTPE
jgi:ribosomal protein S18 acetylase RimI-like enzyme